MKNELIVFAILTALSSCSFAPPTKLGVITSSDNIVKSHVVKIDSASDNIVIKRIEDKIFVVSFGELTTFYNKNEDMINSKSDEYWMPNPSLIFIDGKLHIIESGGGFGKVGLIDKTGKFVWSYKRSPDSSNPSKLLGGDLNSDGIPEFYAATNMGGVHVLDINGKVINKISSGFIGDIGLCDCNGEKILISIDINRKVCFWGFNGELVKYFKTKQYLWDMSIINWPSKNHLLIKDGRSFYILDFDGNIVLKKRAGFRILSLKGTGVHFKGAKNFLAIVTKTISHYNRSILWIFSPDMNLIYKEVICSTEAITAAKDKSKNKEYLLVGGCNSISKYEMR